MNVKKDLHHTLWQKVTAGTASRANTDSAGDTMRGALSDTFSFGTDVYASGKLNSHRSYGPPAHRGQTSHDVGGALPH